MKLCDLKAIQGEKKKAYRKGRGPGSGNGKTAGRGHKGQNSRAGGGVRPGFEGGQMPLYRRVPKRGFNNKLFAKKYAEIKLYDLNAFDDGTVITAALLIEVGLINKVLDGVKILGNGELDKKLIVQASKFTNSASEKIVAAGGKAEVV